MDKNTLMAAFTILAAEGSRTGSVRKSVVDRVLDSRLTRGKTRKGAKHKIGNVFKPRFLLQTNSNFERGAGIIITPAMYRRMHIAKGQGVPTNGYPRYY